MLLRFDEVLHAWQTLEIRIKGPNGRVELFRSRENDAVGERQVVHNPEMRGTQRNAAVQRNNLTLMQHGRDLQGGIFIALLHHSARHFNEHDGRNQYARDILDRRRDAMRLCPTREVFKPCRRIDQVHTRSLSRVTVVSIPFRNPRILRMACTGMNSTRF